MTKNWVWVQSAFSAICKSLVQTSSVLLKCRYKGSPKWRGVNFDGGNCSHGCGASVGIARSRTIIPEWKWQRKGVYIIRDPNGIVAHVGRSRTGQDGICGRLCQHLNGKSSFVYYHLKQQRALLRSGYTFQYLEVPERRTRALLEAIAAGWLCPLHIDGKADD